MGFDFFGLLNRKDPVCGMKEEKGKGIDDKDSGKWFCSETCKQQYGKGTGKRKGGCCH